MFKGVYGLSGSGEAPVYVGISILACSSASALVAKALCVLGTFGNGECLM